MCKTNSHFENFENTVNLICTECAMLVMIIQTMFAIVNMLLMTGVEISNKPKCGKQTAISKTLKTL